jgi:uncharacterized protein (DUF2384 family)
MANGNVILFELQNLADHLGNQARVAELLDVDKSSVTRWLQKEDLPGPANEERITALRYVIVRLMRFLKGPVAIDWLMGVNAHLGNKRPVDLLRHGRVTEVLSAIEQADHGAFA